MEFRDIENMLRVAADRIDIQNDPLRLLTDRERICDSKSLNLFAFRSNFFGQFRN